MTLATMIGPDDAHRYTTRRAHGRHPAGTTCTVSRPSGAAFLRLTFDDGEIIDAPRLYAEGIEQLLPAEFLLAV